MQGTDARSLTISRKLLWSKKELEVSDVVLLMDRFGYVKTVDTSTYDRNKDTADAENKLILKVKNIDKLCIFHKQRKHASCQGVRPALRQIP